MPSRPLLGVPLIGFEDDGTVTLPSLDETTFSDTALVFLSYQPHSDNPERVWLGRARPSFPSIL